MEKSKYNFRHAKERERFYQDVLKARRETLSKIKDPEKHDVIQSQLRTVVTIDMPKDASQIDKWSKKHPEQGAGRFKGFRTFRDLSLLKLFLLGSNYAAAWRRIAKAGYNIEGRVSGLRRRGSRVTGENVYWQAEIEM